MKRKYCWNCHKELPIFKEDCCRTCYYKKDFEMRKEKQKYYNLQQKGRSLAQLEFFLQGTKERKLFLPRSERKRLQNEIKKRKNYLKKWHPIFWSVEYNQPKIIFSQKREKSLKNSEYKKEKEGEDCFLLLQSSSKKNLSVSNKALSQNKKVI
jgi:hypothetical protein